MQRGFHEKGLPKCDSCLIQVFIFKLIIPCRPEDRLPGWHM